MTNLTYAMADYFWDISSMFYSNQLNYDHFDDSTPTIAGFWNELNEPTTSDDTNERTLPSTALHRLNEDENIKDRDVHNAYGLMQVRNIFSQTTLIEFMNGTVTIPEIYISCLTTKSINLKVYLEKN